MIGRVLDKVRNLAKSAVDTVKSWLGIASPSTVMAEQGMYMALGLAAGMDNHTHLAVNSAKTMAGRVMGAMSGLQATATLAVGGDGAALPDSARVLAMSGSGTRGTTSVPNITEVHLHVAGSVIAQNDLLAMIQRETNRRADRNNGPGWDSQGGRRR
jgi:hypothetical protein